MISAAEVRDIALSLPEAEEIETWDHPTFRVRKKIFATMASDGTSAGVKTTLDEQATLIAADPKTFRIKDHVGHHGWVQVELATADPDEMRELLVEAWRRTAPKRVVSAYDARG
jgi:hypothetical protein